MHARLYAGLSSFPGPPLSTVLQLQASSSVPASALIDSYKCGENFLLGPKEVFVPRPRVTLVPLPSSS